MADYSRLCFAGIYAMLAQVVDWENDTIKVGLLMSSTTALSENSGVDYVDDYTTLDECDSAGYARRTLTNCAVTRDDANRRSELDADDPTWSAIPAATRQIAGAIVYAHVTDDTDSIPIGTIKFASPVTLDGTDFTIPWNSEGIFQWTFPDPAA